MFLYSDIQWTTGDASGGKFGFGGIEAFAGINGCDGVNDVIIPGSLTPAIIGITGTSNVNRSGAWMFRVDQVQGIQYIVIMVETSVYFRVPILGGNKQI